MTKETEARRAHEKWFIKEHAELIKDSPAKRGKAYKYSELYQASEVGYLAAACARVGKGEVDVLIEAIESLDAAWSCDVDRQDMNCISAQLEHKENDAKIAKYKTALVALSAKPVEVGELALVIQKAWTSGVDMNFTNCLNASAKAILERFNVTEKL